MLLALLGSLPVPQWFNRAAPRIKRCQVMPEQLDAPAAGGSMEGRAADR